MKELKLGAKTAEMDARSDRPLTEPLTEAELARRLDRFRGCLLGGAAGDALGYAVEFDLEDRIFARYGDGGITSYDLSKSPVALISDDTQMTLFTANGLILGALGGGKDYLPRISECYCDWLLTQWGSGRGCEGSVSVLCRIPELNDPREPGGTCLRGVGSGASMEFPQNQSKGCGGVMRVSPIGLYFTGRTRAPEEVTLYGAETAALTHGHPLGYLPAAFLARMIYTLVDDEKATLPSAARAAQDALVREFPGSEALDTVNTLINRAFLLASRQDLTDLDCIHRLGEGWVGEEAMAIALFCALRYPNDFAKAITAAVNHMGDSDSTGAITGNLVGAALGKRGIPDAFLEALELRDTVDGIAADLFAAAYGTEEKHSALEAAYRI